MEPYEFSGGIRLVKGMGIVGSASDSYTLIIPEADPEKNEHIRPWYRDIVQGSDWDNEGEAAIDIFKYLKNRFGSNKGYERDGGRISLNAALEHSKGVCKEKSAVFQIMCQILGISSLYVRGYTYTHNDEGELVKARHAWNKVKIQGDVYFVDVTNKVFDNPYSELLDRRGDIHGYNEGENRIVMDHELDQEEMSYIAGK